MRIIHSAVTLLPEERWGYEAFRAFLLDGLAYAKQNLSVTGIQVFSFAQPFTGNLLWPCNELAGLWREGIVDGQLLNT